MSPKKFQADDDCLNYIASMRWPDGEIGFVPLKGPVNAKPGKVESLGSWQFTDRTNP